MIEFTLPIVGLDFPNADRRRTNRRSALMMMAPGDPIVLRAEPANPHDPNAVAVFATDGLQLGYLPAERAPPVSARLRKGEMVRVIFQGMDNGRAFLRLRYGDLAPRLPLASSRSTAPVDETGPIDPDGPLWGA